MSARAHAGSRFGVVKLSVVIPAYNEEKLLAGTLAGLRDAAARSLEPAGIGIEWIVCDNNSSDRTAEIARAGGAIVVFEGVNQIGRARNAGAAAATGDWILFVDADSRPSAELLSDLAEAIQDDSCLGGGAILTMDDLPLAGRILLRSWNRISRVFRYPAGSFLFVRTDAFRSIGGFDASLFAGEEIDLARRLKAAGRPAGRRLRILTAHPMETSPRKLSLYRPAEHLRFFARTIFSGGRALRRRESCSIWYDGRR